MEELLAGVNKKKACANKGEASITHIVPYIARLHFALAILAPMSQRVKALSFLRHI